MIRQLIALTIALTIPALALALAGMRQLGRVPHGVVGSSQVRPIIRSHDWRSLTGIGLFVPKPTRDVAYHHSYLSDLPRVVRGRPLASADI